MRKYIYFAFILLTLTELLFAGSADQLKDAKTVGDMAVNLDSNLDSVEQLIIASAQVAGVGFTVASIFKFKQHKDNPTQIPIGTPIAMLGVAAALLFLPTVLESAGQTIFGGSQSTGGVEGVSEIGG